MISRLETVIQNQNLRKSFGARIKTLRKHRKWTQKELAAKLDMPFSMRINTRAAYMRHPSKKQVELAEIFDATVKFLLSKNRPRPEDRHYKTCAYWSSFKSWRFF